MKKKTPVLASVRHITKLWERQIKPHTLALQKFQKDKELTVK